MAKWRIFQNIGEALTLKGAARKQGRNIEEKDLGLVKRAAMVSHGDQLIWVGRESQLTKQKLKNWAKLSDFQSVDLEGLTILPAFVESHTHLIFAGDRTEEFESRNQGVSYQEIAERGGGILSTVKATRKAKKKELVELAQKRVDRFISQGVGTVEVKSGYALNLKDEIKMLEVARALKKARVINTFLGAHAIPPEFNSSQNYLDHVIQDILPLVKKKNLAERVDIFVESGYFTPQQGKTYFEAAKKLGFQLTGHMDQLNRTEGALLAIHQEALSADHLVQVSEDDIHQIAQSEVTATLLPGADFYLKMNYPPAQSLIKAGARVALATDFNPGSCPTQNLSMIGVLARLEMGMSLPQVISAYTIGGAFALGLQTRIGSLEGKKSLDFSALDGSWKDLFYHVGDHPITQTWVNGRRVFKR